MDFQSNIHKCTATRINIYLHTDTEATKCQFYQSPGIVYSHENINMLQGVTPETGVVFQFVKPNRFDGNFLLYTTSIC